MRVFLVLFTFLVTKNPKLHAKRALGGEKKKTLPEKCLLSDFECDMQQSTKSRTITLHGNKSNFYEELDFKFFFFNSLHTKTLKRR